jgi:hypothetical protein
MLVPRGWNSWNAINPYGVKCLVYSDSMLLACLNSSKDIRSMNPVRDSVELGVLVWSMTVHRILVLHVPIVMLRRLSMVTVVYSHVGISRVEL